MSVRQVINAYYAQKDSSFVTQVLDVLQKNNYKVERNPAAVNDGIYMFFISSAFAADPDCINKMKPVLVSGFHIAPVRLDDTMLDSTTEMFLRRYQWMFAKDYESAENLGRAIADVWTENRDPDIPQYEGDGKFLFISYSHVESELIHAVAAELKKRKINLWYDRNLMLGDLWSKEIAEHINSSRNFLAFISKRFADSENCRTEINLATSSDVQTLVTVVRMRGARLDEGLEMYIRSGAVTLRHERFKDVSALVDAILKTNGVKDCSDAPAVQNKSSGFSFSLFPKKQPKPAEVRYDNTIVIASLYPQTEETAEKHRLPQRKTLKQMMQTADMIRSIDNYNAGKPMYSNTLLDQTESLKGRLKNGQTTDEIVPDAFENVMAASRYAGTGTMMPTKLIGALAMLQGDIAETIESEQRRCSILAAAYTQALEEKGVHIITRDDSETRQIFDELEPMCSILGIRLGKITRETAMNERKAQYDCDITVSSYTHIGMDYLRDHQAVYPEKLKMRPLHAAILSEADEIIINKGEQTLSIVQGKRALSNLYISCARLAETQKSGIDYTAVNGNIRMTPQGNEKIGKYFHVDPSDKDSLILQNAMLNALKAKELHRNGIDYVVQDDRIIRINHDTGIPDTYLSFGNGLRHALEAKEYLPISEDNTETAVISVRGLISLYAKKSGITRVSFQDKEDLLKTWKMNVTEIPLDRPPLKKDWPDRVYTTEEYKISALLKEAFEQADRGRAVIICVPAQAEYEYLQKKMRDKAAHMHRSVFFHGPGITYEQSEMVMKTAGRSGQITLLKGHRSDRDIEPDERCLAAGGLYVIASSHFEKTIQDEQMRSIAGRNSEPGDTVIYVSLQDPQIRPFISDSLNSFYEDLQMDENLDSKLVRKSIDKLMEKLSGAARENEKITEAYTNVFEAQRKQIYADRERILYKDRLNELYEEMIRQYVKDTMNGYSGPLPRTPQECNRLAEEYFPNLTPQLQNSDLSSVLNSKDNRALCDALSETLIGAFRKKYSGLNENASEIAKMPLLKMLDTQWAEHYAALEKLRNREMTYAGLREYFPAYQETAVSMYTGLLQRIREESIAVFFNLRHNGPGQNSSTPAKAESKGVSRMQKKINPNDPCPCGSGKKYKYCHGRVQ